MATEITIVLDQEVRLDHIPFLEHSLTSTLTNELGLSVASVDVEIT